MILCNFMPEKFVCKPGMAGSFFHFCLRFLFFFCLVCTWTEQQNLDGSKKERLPFLIKQWCLCFGLFFHFSVCASMSIPWLRTVRIRMPLVLRSVSASISVTTVKHLNNQAWLTKISISVPLPRYVRVNTLKTSVERVIKNFKEDGFKQLDSSSNSCYKVMSCQLMISV